MGVEDRNRLRILVGKAHLTGDFDSAKKVEPDLPETGVCSANLMPQNSAQSCCGTEVSKC